jgi:hypothetical protein
MHFRLEPGISFTIKRFPRLQHVVKISRRKPVVNPFHLRCVRMSVLLLGSGLVVFCDSQVNSSTVLHRATV